jgi:hypothetical protein
MAIFEPVPVPTRITSIGNRTILGIAPMPPARATEMLKYVEQFAKQ